jgi:hypothetical protein
MVIFVLRLGFPLTLLLCFEILDEKKWKTNFPTDSNLVPRFKQSFAASIGAGLCYADFA